MKQVLVVDDDNGMRAALETRFLRRGWQVESAASAAEALEKFRRGRHPLIVTDIRMPGRWPAADVPALVSGTVVSRRQAGRSRTPIRLTRRGRAVVACLLVTGLTVTALLISLLVSGGAQATNHGQPRAGYQGMHQIVVRAGQTLWSIAVSAEPSADTRVVVQEIMTANALTSADISAGQLLWVPR